ncbi:MAG TPA: GNAT family N-acetyltransferase [Lacunisphaera sp.]|nr:GNAT family N-acetyltransferase [Lacunisphaera sp.]
MKSPEMWNGKKAMLLPETPRLVFREFGEADLPELAGLLDDPKVMQYSWQGPRDLDGSREVLAGFQRTYRELGFGKWALFDRDGGEFVGYCGLERCAVVDVNELELGYRLNLKFWGQGLAAEAAAAAVKHAFDIARLTGVIAFVEPANAASVRVLEQTGFRRTASAVPMNGKAMDIYRIAAPE